MTYTDRIIPVILPNAWSKQTGPENCLNEQRLLGRWFPSTSKTPWPHQPLSAASMRPWRRGTAKKTLLPKHRQQLEIFVLQFWERKGSTMEIAGPCAERQDGCSRQSLVCRVGRRVSCRLCQLSVWVQREAQGLQDCWEWHMRERSRHSTFQQWVTTRGIWRRDSGGRIDSF